jgi:aconitate decarboxylase
MSVHRHAWWEPKRPFTTTAAQMHAAFVAAVQIHDKQVLPAQFANDMLNRDAIWTLIDKTHCLHIKDFDAPDHPWRQRVTITFSDGVQMSQLTVKPKGVDPALTNEEIVDKWRSMARGIMPASKVQEIESLVLGMNGLDDVTKLTKALNFTVKNPLDVGNEVESRTGRQVMANL